VKQFTAFIHLAISLISGMIVQYSTTSLKLGADPGFLAVSPQVTYYSQTR